MEQITSKTDWTIPLLENAWKEIQIIAEQELGLGPNDLYVNQFEIVGAEQMLDAYSSVGLPVHYNHWSYGKDFLKNYDSYQRGQSNLAYEMVINTNPCINLLMEENPAITQILTIAHAAVGHNAVFKNNEYFKYWSQAGSILDYMVFARDFIRQCEERYGYAEVEAVLDACHALAPHAIDKYKRKHQSKLSDEMRLKKLMAEDEEKQKELDIILKKTTIENDGDQTESESTLDEENLLYFIMKQAPALETWKREIIRIVYKVNTYFSPQGVTKILNEGFASFSHYYIMRRLEEKGIISPDAFIAAIQLHSGVIYQPNYNQRGYSGPNPYTLGFNILMDVKRICENPTEEDKRWFPKLIGMKWQDAIKEAAFQHRDDSFIQQYLSPKVIRDMKLFNVKLETVKTPLGLGNFIMSNIATVTEIHDDVGYAEIRTNLARSVERINYVPMIRVIGADLKGDRILKLKYETYQNRELNFDDAELVLKHIKSLWGYDVELEYADEDEIVLQ